MRGRKAEKFKEAGITLIALVVTIIVLLILAGVTISIVLGNNGLLGRAQEGSNTYANATKNEARAMSELTDEIDNLTARPLAEEKIAAVNSKTTLQTIAYTPATTDAEVSIPSDNNGGVDEQNITQTSLGVSSLNWYVLSADENGVNIVSDATNASKSNIVKFQGWSGYDNCLYYLNEIATKLFTNEESYGVDASRVHALRLSDIEYAAKQMNGSSYDWETTFVNGATTKSTGVTNIGDSKTCSSSYTKYPKIYGTSTGSVITNNVMKDENPSEEGVPIASDSGTTASSLTIKGTYYSYSNQRTTMITNLGTFGSSGVASKLFDASAYWLASRCVDATSSGYGFGLYGVYSGYLFSNSLCGSAGSPDYSYGRACRVVVSIPPSHVNIATDGTVTLK